MTINGIQHKLMQEDMGCCCIHDPLILQLPAVGCGVQDVDDVILESTDVRGGRPFHSKRQGTDGRDCQVANNPACRQIPLNGNGITV